MPRVPQAASPRIEWADVPARVRDAVDADLGSPIVLAVTQVGGFSPGAAVRVVCANGRRAFVKAVGACLNPDTVNLNRAEIIALQLLPEGLPAPRLLASYDDDGWVALVLEDIDGRQPDLPWTSDDVAATAATLAAVARTPAHEALPAFADKVMALSAWDDVAADPRGIDPALLNGLPGMLDAQALAHDVTRGTGLVHWDARADNVLIHDGHAVLLDWAWACRGAPWLDTLLLAMDFRVQGGPDADSFLGSNPVTRDVPAAHLHAVIACMLGVWAERARRPAPPGLPTLRAWQAHCRDHARRWLDEGALWS